MKKILISLALCCVAFAHAEQPQNVVNLSAQATVEVAHDMLYLTLSTTVQGDDAQRVQRDVQRATEQALAVLRAKQAQPAALSFRTGRFALQPQYNRDGVVTGWVGVSELQLEGRDFKLLAQTAAEVKSMGVAATALGVSRELRHSTEQQLTQEAIGRFKQQAAMVAKEFGFQSFTLREVSVNGQEPWQPQVMARSVGKMSVAAAEALPVEAGKSTVTVSVSGSVVLKP